MKLRGAFRRSYKTRLVLSYFRKKPDLLLKDIARIVGFEDQAYFSKVFKRVKGAAPADFRDGGVRQ